MPTFAIDWGLHNRPPSTQGNSTTTANSGSGSGIGSDQSLSQLNLAVNVVIFCALAASARRIIACLRRCLVKDGGSDEAE